MSPIIITLKSYLARLKDSEQARPPAERRTVPSLVALAKEVGQSRTQLQRIADNRIVNLNLGTTAAIIEALRRRGFATDVSDLLEYRNEGEQ